MASDTIKIENPIDKVKEYWITYDLDNPTPPDLAQLAYENDIEHDVLRKRMVAENWLAKRQLAQRKYQEAKLEALDNILAKAVTDPATIAADVFRSQLEIIQINKMVLNEFKSRISAVDEKGKPLVATADLISFMKLSNSVAENTLKLLQSIADALNEKEDGTGKDLNQLVTSGFKDVSLENQYAVLTAIRKMEESVDKESALDAFDEQ
jgi:hypothetical protein